MKTYPLPTALLLLLSASIVVKAQECFDAGDCLDDPNSNNLPSLEVLEEAHTNENDTHQADILILICTQSFKGEELVEDVLLDALLESPPLASIKVDVHLVDEAGLDWTEESLEQSDQDHLLLSAYAPVVLVVASTYGDGDPPNHALTFADWLGRDTNSIQDPIQFAVFGLGDKVYAHFNKFGLFVDQQLQARGGNRLLDVHLGDAQQDLSGAFQQWTHALVQEALPKYFGTAQREESQASQQQRRPLFSSTGMDWRRTAITPGSMQGTLVSQQELLEQSNEQNNSTKNERSVLHIALQVPTHQLPFPVQPGDHLGIHPRNPPRLVYDALHWLEIQDPNFETTILEKNTNGNNPSWLERKLTAYEFLEQHVDLAGRATPSILRALLPFAGTLQLRALARDLTFVNTSATSAESETAVSPFDKWVATQVLAQQQQSTLLFFSKLDLAKWFDCRPSLQALARALGPLQARLYSIATVDHPPATAASSNQHLVVGSANPPTTEATTTTTTIGLCVSITQGGLCTNFLANLARQDRVTVFVKQSKFHFVTDEDDTTATEEPKPIVLIAAGSGIGPYQGFLQTALERRVQQAGAQYQLQYIAAPTRPLSHVRLLVGARTPDEVLYKDQLKVWNRIGGATVDYAFSRVPGQPKHHVQDLLGTFANNSTETMDAATQRLWQDVFVNEGRIYACGRLEICESVRQALWHAATQVGGMQSLEADQYIERMEQQGNLLTDCWSVEGPPSLEQMAGNRSSGSHQQGPYHALPRLERHHQHSRREDSSAANSNQTRTTANNVDLSTIPAWPSYLRMVASGEFERRIEEATDMFSACVACGRFCEVDRLSPESDDWGECRIGQQAIVSAVDAHFGEEPCLKGVNGSGTIFLGACNLKCVYCQNWKISAMDRGEVVSDERLAEYMLHLQERGCHNINFVSPTHNILPILRGIFIAAKNGLRLPIVFNSGGYDSVASLRLLDGIIDIYMPDAKYASRAVARKLSRIDNYPEINQAAIKEMYRQVGDLQIDPRTGLAYRGLLVRHLVLPNDYGGTFDVADFLTNEVSGNTYTHVMKYYRPEHEAANDKKFGLNRRPSSNELQEAHKRARFAGLQRILY